jgi:hypothetical protein
MPTNFPMPSADHFREVLGDLMGRGVSLARAAKAEIGADKVGALAEYRDDDGALGVICVADLRLTNALGAALTMVSPSIVEDAVAKQKIDQPTIDNLREVVNVMTNLFNTDNTPHLKFRDLHAVPSELPAETTQFMKSPKGRRDFDVTVQDYPTGTLSVLLA